jgi:hypothetical protein
VEGACCAGVQGRRQSILEQQNKQVLRQRLTSCCDTHVDTEHFPTFLWQQCQCCPATAPEVHFSRAMHVATACNNRFCADTSALQYTVHLRANGSQHAVHVVNVPSCSESAQCYVSHWWVTASKSCGSAPPHMCMFVTRSNSQNLAVPHHAGCPHVDKLGGTQHIQVKTTSQKHSSGSVSIR